ncbi:hypothetical protein TRFO_39380 [Tritrichomonas foetus]|uniref:Initiator binding domain-containing protein n=1 Tax=Tritrichomonas foetus TaxID=1144522 RepID=A0A1J4J591_9EUKA|nr:hypothetical protein TRFO_39380 [Tritrichomonas foetus]|eukprot:OHS94430.1 hypothetical protein TRFO_39380 [Tritrichomonas foetus]
MSHQKPEQNDPFSLFGLPESNNDPFDDDWDPFAETLDQFDSESDPNQDVFAPVEFTNNELPVQHRRTISTPQRVLSPQPVYPTIQTPIMQQLPIAMSTCDFQRMRPMYSPPTFVFRIPDFSPDNATFYTVCNDISLRFNPRRIGFIPPNMWEDRDMTFGECVQEFFQRKNNANSRFSHKLFNSLKLSEYNPIYTPFVGVKWLNENILRVDKRAFARLLGIKSIDGSLFHQQGNFPSHGFFEIGAGDVQRYCPPNIDLTGVDFENVRLLIHTENLFKRGCTEADIEHCRWANTRK